MSQSKFLKDRVLLTKAEVLCKLKAMKSSLTKDMRYREKSINKLHLEMRLEFTELYE